MFRALCRCQAPSAFALPTSSIFDTSAAVRTRNVSGTSYATASPLRTVSMLCCLKQTAAPEQAVIHLIPKKRSSEATLCYR